tara:strand:+ start:931 stop:1671 length:741 start_codon:yes stop_codon:yes gene_type:complete
MKNTRVYINKKISNGFVELDEPQTHYIKNVMRLKIGEKFNIFNENQGEWLVELSEFNKKISIVKILKELGLKDLPSDVWILFAPVKKLRVDFIAQKVTELGARLIWPVNTERTQYKTIKKSKILSNAIEAAEQCGLTFIPKVNDLENLEDIIDSWDKINPDRTLIFCDENSYNNPKKQLEDLKKTSKSNRWAILIGPEGGFSDKERQKINKVKNLNVISLGPRILRSDTAIVSSLSLFHSILGDWV